MFKPEAEPETLHEIRYECDSARPGFCGAAVPVMENLVAFILGGEADAGYSTV